MKKIKEYAIILSVVYITLFTVEAEAAANLNGTTGLINIPSADVVREGHFFLGYYNFDENNLVSFGLQPIKNLEVSVNFADWDDRRQENLVNAKYAVFQENVFLPGMAVGVEDIGANNKRSAYAVISKALPLGFRIHAGYGNGHYDGVFYGLEKNIFPGLPGTFPDTDLLVEYDGNGMNYGLRMSLLAGLKVNAGWRDHDPYVGVTYNFY